MGFRLDLEFDDAEKELGQSLFDDACVALEEEGEGGYWEATVRHFKRNVLVWVKTSPDGRVEHDCDCAHFDNTGRGCEHLWALSLAAAPPEDDDDAAAASIVLTYLVVGAESERALAPVVSVRGADGAAVRITHETWAAVEDDDDIAALRAMASAAGGWAPVKQGGGYMRPDGPWTLSRATACEVVTRLAATGRALVERKGALTALQGARGPTLEFVVAIDEVEDDVSFSGRLMGRGVATDLGDADLVVPGLAIVGGVVHALEDHGAVGWLTDLRRGRAPRVAPAALMDELERHGAETALPRLAWGPDPAEVETAPPRGAVAATTLGGRCELRLAFEYGRATPIPPLWPGRLVLDRERRRQYRRDAAAEEGLIDRLLRAGAEPDPDVPDLFRLPGPGGGLLRALLEEGWTVRSRHRTARPATVGALRVEGGTDWFEVSGEIDVAGESVPLPRVLAGLRDDDDFIELDGDRLLLLTQEDRERILAVADLADLGRETEKGIRLSAAQALLAETSLRPAAAERDAAFEKLRADLATFGGVERVATPDDLRATLHPWQEDGLAWMEFLDRFALGGCLADEMGLGKTVQVIAHLLRRNESSPHGPHLVVVPRSLVTNWTAEIARFAPGLRIVDHAGSRRDIGAASAGDVVVTTYGILRRDIDDLAAVPFDHVVLDEAQAIKNPASGAAGAARRLDAARRLALTGTPIENSADELWSLMEFLNPGMLGPRRGFAARVRRGDRDALTRALRPVLLRRTKADVADDLPELMEQTVLCDMEEGQAAAYDELLAATRRHLDGAGAEPRAGVLVLEALLRLRQAACHAGLVGDEGGSGKIEVLLDRLDEVRARGGKALVFSQFTSLLALVREALEERGHRHAYLDGSTRDREAPIRTFREQADCGVFLISLRAGGYGLNLTEAEHVFILDPWWNPAVEAQAVGRAHRLGQDRPVLAQRLVSRGTVEEKILDLQETKRDLAASLIDGDRAGVEGIGLDELMALIAS